MVNAYGRRRTQAKGVVSVGLAAVADAGYCYYAGAVVYLVEDTPVTDADSPGRWFTVVQEQTATGPCVP
jgi:hypothetical protein